MIFPPSLTKKNTLIAAAMIACLGLLAYSNTFKVPFHFDDQLVIVESSIIRSLNNADRLFLYDPSRFLTHLSFALNYHFGRLDLVGFHIVNLLLHIANAFLVYILLQLTLSLSHPQRVQEKDVPVIAVLAALLFTVHPLQTQAVTYIVQRSTLLAAFCYLSALILYLISRQQNDIRYYAGAVAMMFIGIFTKPIIVSFPAAVILYEACFLSSRKSDAADRVKIILRLLPFILLALMVPLFIMTWKFKAMDVERYWDLTKETQSFTRGEYLLTQFNVLITYLRMLVLPYGQNLDHHYPIAKSFFAFPTWLSFSALAIILGAAVKAFRRHRLIAFGIFWMAVTLALESSVFPIADVINEHRLYLPMVGFALMVVLFFRRLLESKSLFIAGVAVIVLIMAAMTYQRNIVWGDKIGMLLDIIKKSPTKARAYNNLGIAYAAQDRLPEAEAAYKRAIELNPKFAHPHNNLANVYFKQNRLDEAQQELLQALALEPQYAGAYYNLGNVAWMRGDAVKAREYYKRAVDLNPNFVLAMVGFAKACRLTRDFKRSEFVLLAAQKIDPTHDGIYVNLGDLYLTVGEYDKALRQYQIALRYTQQPAVMLNNIGNLYDMFYDFEQAKMMYKEAIWRDPGYPHSYYNLSATLYKMGDLVQSRMFLEKALALYTEQGDSVMAQKVQERLQRFIP